MTAVRVVDRVRTPTRIDEMLRVGAEAYTLEFDAVPTTNELAMAAAQWTSEHGVQPNVVHGTRGERIIWFLWNDNWGNITCKAEDEVDKTTLTTNERVRKKGTKLPDGSIVPEDVWRVMTLYYVAYDSPLEGARGYWRKLADRYGKSLDAFATGNTKLVAQTLSDQMYYTDHVEKYESILAYYFPRYFALLSTGNERP